VVQLGVFRLGLLEDLDAWIGVARTCLPQKRVVLPGRTYQRRLQQVIDLFPSIGIHPAPPVNSQ
jgi:hypothetical protein